MPTGSRKDAHEELLAGQLDSDGMIEGVFIDIIPKHLAEAIL